jgi:hypothetical protein
MRPAGGCVKSIEPAQHRSAELTQSRERQLHLSFHARNRGDSETRSLASGTPQQRRLSDTRLSTDDQDRALPPRTFSSNLSTTARSRVRPLNPGRRWAPISPFNRKRPGVRPGGFPSAKGGDRAQSICVVAHPEEAMGTNSVAIVPGGFAQCGRQVARKLAGQGFAVVLNYARNQGQADAAVEEILAADGIALASAPTSRTSSTSSGCSPRPSRRSGVSTSW